MLINEWKMEWNLKGKELKEMENREGLVRKGFWYKIKYSLRLLYNNSNLLIKKYLARLVLVQCKTLAW